MGETPCLMSESGVASRVGPFSCRGDVEVVTRVVELANIYRGCQAVLIGLPEIIRISVTRAFANSVQVTK